MKIAGNRLADLTYELQVENEYSIVTVRLDGEVIYEKTFGDETHEAMLDFTRNDILVNLRANPIPFSISPQERNL